MLVARATIRGRGRFAEQESSSTTIANNESIKVINLFFFYKLVTRREQEMGESVDQGRNETKGNEKGTTMT